MKKGAIKNIITSIISLFVFISTLVITLQFVFDKQEEIPDSASANGVLFFKYFTSDSNVLVALICVIILVFAIKNIAQKTDKMPKWLIILFTIATTGTTVTFLTTAFFLGPTTVINGNSYFTMFEGRLFFLHFLTPILAIILNVLFLNYHRLNWKHALLCVSTILVYSFVYIPCVLSGTWIDFYGFTFGGQMWVIPLALIIMYGLAIGIGFGLMVLHNLRVKKVN